MLKRMNLVRWFMLVNALSWIPLWGRVIYYMRPFDPHRPHGHLLIWMVIGHHAVGTEALDYFDLLSKVILVTQIGWWYPLRLVFNAVGDNWYFLGIDDNGWFFIVGTIVSFIFWYAVARAIQRKWRLRS